MGYVFCHFEADWFIYKKRKKFFAILWRNWQFWTLCHQKNSCYFVEFVSTCFPPLSSLDILILLDHLLRSFLLFFFLSSWEYRCKRARKISKHTHTRIAKYRASYSTVVLARNPGFNVSLMNLSLLLHRVTTTIVSPEEISCPSLRCLLLSSAIFLPFPPNSDSISNHFVAHRLLSQRQYLCARKKHEFLVGKSIEIISR